MAFFMSKPYIIPTAVYTQLLSHLKTCLPEEGCGLLASHNNIVQLHYPVTNIRHSPTRYEMDPKTQIEAFIDAEAQGMTVTAVYHSHPKGPSTPSATDIAEATYPELIYLIISLEQPNAPSMRGFLIVDDQVSEVTVTVV